MTSKKRLQLERKLQNTLTNCILLSPKEKRDWFEQISSMPDIFLQYLIQKLNEKKAMVDNYITEALQSDSQGTLLKDFKKDFKTIKHKVFELQERMTQNTADENLEIQIKNL